MMDSKEPTEVFVHLCDLEMQVTTMAIFIENPVCGTHAKRGWDSAMTKIDVVDDLACNCAGDLRSVGR